MSLVTRYVIRRVFIASLVILAAACAMLITAQVLNRLDMLVKSTSAAVTAILLAMTVVPPIVIVLLPLALLIAACRILGEMQGDSELVVLAAAGCSRWKTAAPVVALSLVLSMICAVISLYIEPWANRSQQTVLASATVDIIQFAVRAGNFITMQDGLLLKVGESYADGKFGGIMIIDEREKNSSRIYYARYGQVIVAEGQGRLVLVDGELHIKGANASSASRVAFRSNVVDLASLQPAGNSRQAKPRERSIDDVIASLETDLSPKERSGLLLELNRRLTDWIYVIVMGLVAVLVSTGPRSHRADQTWRLTLAVVIGLCLRGPGFFFVNLSGQSEVMAAMSYIWPIAATVGLFAMLILGGERPSRGAGFSLASSLTGLVPAKALARWRGAGPSSR